MGSPAEPRVALVGAGHWGRNLARNLHELGHLEIVCEHDPVVRETVEGRLGGVRTTGSFAEVINDPAIGAVAIATPASTHAALVREALLAGKDVYVEKPLALSEGEGEALVRLADEQDRLLMVGHLLWYHPAIRELERVVADGELGRTLYLYSNRLNLGRLRREENVLWSFAPHDVSVILGLVGEMPASVQAQGGNYLHRQIADTTVTLLEFASGVRAHIFVSWLHPYKEQRLVVVGERQMAVFDDTAPWGEKLALYPHRVEWEGTVPVARRAEAEFVPLEEREPLREECRHFLRCVSEREAPRTDGAEGLRVLRVLNACERALSSERAVPVAGRAPDHFVHETAVVDPGARIGRGTRIWHFSHVLGETEIGDDCSIGQNVVIGPRVRVGRGCRIQNNVSVYEGVTLEDDVFCGPSMVFTNVLNPRSHVSRKDEFRATRVCSGATIGANATIVCGHTLGAHCFVGAGAVVTGDVPAHALVVGNPARRVGWMSRHGERLDERLVCPVTGTRHRQIDGGLEEIEEIGG